MLGAIDGYRRVEADNIAREIAIFTSQYGLYRFKQMPITLPNSPSRFQRTKDVALSADQWQFLLVCIDNIVVLFCSGAVYNKSLTNF